MRKEDFNFDLPEELIAQDPLEDRSSSDCSYWIRRRERQKIMCSEKS